MLHHLETTSIQFFPKGSHRDFRANLIFRTKYSRTRFFLLRQLELSEGTSRALRILNKGREYQMPKPDEEPEKSSESSSDDSSSETSESSCESYNADEDEGSGELSSEEETETATTAERAPSTPDKLSSNQTVVLGEGFSQISESSYQTLQRRLQDPMMLQTLWKAMITLRTACNYMSTLIVPENRDSTQSIPGRSRLLSLKVKTKRKMLSLLFFRKCDIDRQITSPFAIILSKRAPRQEP